MTKPKENTLPDHLGVVSCSIYPAFAVYKDPSDPSVTAPKLIEDDSVLRMSLTDNETERQLRLDNMSRLLGKLGILFTRDPQRGKPMVSTQGWGYAYLQNLLVLLISPIERLEPSESIGANFDTIVPVKLLYVPETFKQPMILRETAIARCFANKTQIDSLSADNSANAGNFKFDHLRGTIQRWSAVRAKWDSKGSALIARRIELDGV